MDDATYTQTSAIASGDTEALSRFYEYWFDRLYAEARRVTRKDESFCLDVVQDVMMRVIKSIKPMQSEAQLWRWLQTVVRSCAYDRLRKEIRRQQREGSVNYDSTRTDLAETNEQLRWLEQQINELDHRDVNLLIMRHRFGWTLKRIGRALGMTTGAVDGRLTRLTSRLRDKAKERFHDGVL